MTKNRKHKITNGFANKLPITGENYIVWDTELTGFAVRVNSGGRKTFFFKYNAPGRITRKITIGKHGTLTADDARKAAKGYARKVAAGEDPAARKTEYRESMTVADFCQLYIERYAKVRKKPTGVYSDQGNIKNHILPAIGKKKIMAVQKADIVRLHHSLSETPYAANRVLALLSVMFNQAIEWSVLPPYSNPCKGVKKYKEKSRERFLTADEVKRLLDTLNEIDRERSEHPSVTNAIRLLVLTGCRRGEILTLKWEYVDRKNKRFNLPDSKTGKKTVPIGEAVLGVLDAIPRRNDNEYVIYGPRSGEYFKDIHHQWQRIRKRAELPTDLRIHDLRHTYASFALSRGYSLSMIGKILGHRDITTTQRYAHLAADPVTAAVSDIAGTIAGATRNQTDGDAKKKQLGRTRQGNGAADKNTIPFPRTRRVKAGSDTAFLDDAE